MAATEPSDLQQVPIHGSAQLFYCASGPAEISAKGSYQHHGLHLTLRYRLPAISAALALSLGGGVAMAQSGSSAGEASIFGRWMTHDNAGIVEIRRCGKAACGTLVRVLDPAAPRNDINNPDPALRDRDLVGIRVLSGFTAQGGRWEDGKAYDPKAGRTVSARMSLASPDRLDLTGCVLIVCRTMHWTRVGED